MKKAMLLLICVGLWSLTPALADVIYVSGDVFGTWSADSVIVTAEVRVPPDSTLVIEPGVKVLFQVYCKFIVDSNAVLSAQGTPRRPITFTELTSGVRWHGIRFDHAAGNSSLRFCHISEGLASGSYEDSYGGGIFCQNSQIEIDNCIISNCEAQKGAGIYLVYSESSITNCIITGDSYGYGQGIYCALGNPTISRNIIYGNLEFGAGGGICCSYASPEISGNLISANGAGDGAGIYLDHAQPTITSNLIVENHTLSPPVDYLIGGGIHCLYSSALIYHNLFYDNSAYGFLEYGKGGAISLSNSSPVICQNTIVENTALYPGGAGGGIACHENSYPTIVNCVLWDNFQGQITSFYGGTPDVTYSDIEDGFPGSGNINELPCFIDSALCDFRLRGISPCIDAGDPDPQYNDPDGTRSDMGAFFYDQSQPIHILLTPHDIPYLFPAEGGTLNYTLRIINRDSLAHSVTIWCDMTLPGNTTTAPMLGPVTVNLEAGAAIIRVRLQDIPSTAPLGVYSYNAYAIVGQDTSRDSFMFGKLGTGGFGLAAGGWANTGELLFTGAQTLPGTPQPIHPSSFSPYPCFPNPFNPTTTIRFGLPEASSVILHVHDLQGRLVATLVDGIRDTGFHEVTFDASALASGVYLYRLQTNDFSATGKLVL
ncbi:MAG: right-handed parallel beta-helix repeat-containing protein, partial [bacterium]